MVLRQYSLKKTRSGISGDFTNDKIILRDFYRFSLRGRKAITPTYAVILNSNIIHTRISVEYPMIPVPDALKQPQLIARPQYRAEAMTNVNIAAIAILTINVPLMKIPPTKHIPTNNSA